MALITSSVKSSDEIFEHEDGWLETTIRKAEYGTSDKGKKYLDVWFDGLPDKVNARCFATVNGKTKEEFRIRNWFRFSNGGVESCKDGMLQHDDDPQNLIGMPINVLVFHNNKGYVDIFREPAPMVMNTDEQEYTEKNVQYWKNKAVMSLKSYMAYFASQDIANFVTPTNDIPVANGGDNTPF